MVIRFNIFNLLVCGRDTFKFLLLRLDNIGHVKKSATHVLAGKHFVDFFDFNSVMVIFCSKTKHVPVLIVPEHVLRSKMVGLNRELAGYND